LRAAVVEAGARRGRFQVAQAGFRPVNIRRRTWEQVPTMATCSERRCCETNRLMNIENGGEELDAAHTRVELMNDDGGTPAAEAPVPEPVSRVSLAPIAPEARIPVEKRERFQEVALMLECFGQSHLDPELTGFTLELWRRLCRRQTIDCRRGKAHVWAASVVHVIARINFLFDRSQPVHLTFDTICGWFQANKTTVGSKATGIERALRLRQHSEPGLCRRKFIDDFTTVQLSNGVVLSLSMAKQTGLVPPDAMPR
jgi:hypothetical protein